MIIESRASSLKDTICKPDNLAGYLRPPEIRINDEIKMSTVTGVASEGGMREPPASRNRKNVVENLSYLPRVLSCVLSKNRQNSKYVVKIGEMSF